MALSAVVHRGDVIREVQSQLDAGGWQLAKRIVSHAEAPEGTWLQVPTTGGGRRSMSQAEAKRLVEAAKARIALADAED